MISSQSALASMSVNVSIIKENVDNEYRRLTQVRKQRFLLQGTIRVLLRIVNKNLIL